MTTRKLRLTAALGTGIGLLGLVALGGGCFRQAQTAPLSARQSTTLADALVASREGRSVRTNQVAGYNLRALGNGGLEISRPGVSYEGRLPVRGVNDALLTTKVKSVLAADTNVKATIIHVDTTSDGIVQLTGDADSPQLAVAAIRDALNLVGVNAVDSYLTFKNMR